MNSIQKVTRVAGFLYLTIAIVAPLSLMVVPSALIVPGNAAATASNIMASKNLFRLGVAGESVVFLIEMILPILLYILLKPVSKTLSLFAMSSRLAMAVIQGINVLNKVLVLHLLSGAAYLKAFEPDQSQALVLLFLDAHKYGEAIWGAFFGLHLFALGYLVLESGHILSKSGYMRRILSVLLMIGSIGYLMDSFRNLLLLDNEVLSIVSSVLLIASVIGEVSFFLWLLIKGVNVEEWEKRALESA
jgi:uncharacterized protein DUF4386